MLETIKEEEEIKQKNIGIREQIDEDNKIDNMVDLYYKL